MKYKLLALIACLLTITSCQPQNSCNCTNKSCEPKCCTDKCGTTERE